MKNLFAIVLMLLVALLCACESTTISTEEQLGTQSQMISNIETSEEDTSTLTVEFIKNSTWDELVSISQDNFITIK